MARLFIADPAIDGRGGHYSEYAGALVEAASAAGVPAVTLAHRSLLPTAGDRLHARPTFTHGFWQRAVRHRKLGFFLNPSWSNLVLWRDLRRALSAEVTNLDVVFMPTLDHHQMLAWGWWLASLPAHKRPRVRLLWRYTYFPGASPTPWRNSWWVRFGGRQLHRWVMGGRLLHLTDSRRLAQQYEGLLREHVGLVPISHTRDLPAQAPPPDLNAPLRFVFLGDARAEKGFLELVDAVTGWGGAPGRAEFYLQCFVSSAHAEMASAVAALRVLGAGHVHLLEHPLERPHYCRLIASADVVLLPYHRDIYYARTSGPFTEALAAGKPVVVTADTWMSDELEHGGSGLTTADRDAADLGRALVQAAEKRVTLADQARARQAEWRARHNPEALLRVLME